MGLVLCTWHLSSVIYLSYYIRKKYEKVFFKYIAERIVIGSNMIFEILKYNKAKKIKHKKQLQKTVKIKLFSWIEANARQLSKYVHN